MKTYNYQKINNCYLYGSLNGEIESFVKNVIDMLNDKKNYKERTHPKEIERRQRIEQRVAQGGNHRIVHGGPRSMKMMKSSRSRLSNCLVIVNGNTGFGSKNLKYYTDKFDELNTLLEDNNCHIAFVRGSFDDPKFFENETISYSHIKTIQDYSVLMLENFNCLCIGGSISIDREWRKKQEERTGKKMYWENEGMKYDEKAIEEILDTMDIACVVTNSSPSFSYPGTNSLNSSLWALNDKTVMEDMQNERKTIDKIYSKFTERDKKPYIWAYSMFLNDNHQFMNDILFKSLPKQEIYSFNKSIMDNFNIDLSKKLTKNTQAIDRIIGDLKQNVRLDGNNFYFDFGHPNDPNDAVEDDDELNPFDDGELEEEDEREENEMAADLHARWEDLIFERERLADMQIQINYVENNDRHE